MILAERAPVAAGEKVLVVSSLSVDIVGEYRDHIFVRVGVQVVHFVAFVQDIRHHVWWWCIYDGRRGDVEHISVVKILGDAEFLTGVELTDSS